MEFLRSVLTRILRCGPLLWALFVIWLGILFFFSSNESPKDIPTLLPHQDKVIHFVSLFHWPGRSMNTTSNSFRAGRGWTPTTGRRIFSARLAACLFLGGFGVQWKPMEFELAGSAGLRIIGIIWRSLIS